jgi:hypothetical protein
MYPGPECPYCLKVTTAETYAEWLARIEAENCPRAVTDGARRRIVRAIGGRAMPDEYVYINGSFEALKANAEATDRDAILRAAEALKRDEATPDHMMDLHTAVLRMRGPYAVALEREVNAYMRLVDWKDDDGGLNEHLRLCRDEMRLLFRRDCETVIREAEGE